MTARVIVHADDFGLHPSLNEGIELAHREGLVTSASLMPTGPAFADAVYRVKSLPNLDLGLHFALVGVPGCPPTLGAFLSAYGRGLMPTHEIEAALHRQFAALGSVDISHIDSHQHLHALPGIMRVVCRFAAENSIPAVRLPIDGPAYTTISPGRRVQAATLAVMARLSRRYITAYGLHTSDHFSGMAISGHLTAPILDAYLEHARDGLTEIVCHPGADNHVLSQTFDWGYDWQGELTALRSSQASSITLTNWQELTKDEKIVII